MAIIDFKSVGERADSEKFKVTKNEVPIGIKTPLRLGSQNDGIFSMHFSLTDQIQDNFRNLLLTNHGERLGLYDFGTNLRELSLEYGQETFDVEAIRRIRTAISRYMPFIEPRTFESTVVSSGNAISNIRLMITYDLPNLGVSSKKIEVTISVGG